MRLSRGEAGMRPHSALSERNAEDLGLYFEVSERPPKGFNYRTDIVRSVILKSNSELV